MESDGYCANCPLAYLSLHANSHLGLLIQSADHLSFCLSQGVTITMDDLSILEYKALRVLVEERAKAQEEQQEERQARQMAEQSRALSRSVGGAGVSRAKPISHLDSA